MISEKAKANLKQIIDSPSFRLAETDLDYLTCPELRGATAAGVAKAGNGFC